MKGRYMLKPWREVGAGDFEGTLSFIQHVKANGPFLMVIITSPHAARMVAHAIDSAGWPEVNGTVAGDDTLFLGPQGE